MCVVLNIKHQPGFYLALLPSPISVRGGGHFGKSAVSGTSCSEN